VEIVEVVEVDHARSLATGPVRCRFGRAQADGSARPMAAGSIG
jgi:hypothetical protein